jgi:hypothetical protein
MGTDLIIIQPLEMKKIFTLAFTLTVLLNGVRSQVMLNELYTSPGGGNSEFFELYNSGTTTESVDGFTIVTYFEQGSNSGFYVLDLPALTLNADSYLVGASSSPFNYQAATGANPNFDWNSASLITNGGYLKKWVKTGTDASDGNIAYNEASISPNFNDFFYEKSNGANYSVFVFKNGLLINSFYGGTSSTTQPSFITSMPSLNVTSVVGASTVPFTINFSSFTANMSEYVNPSAGTDNGYIRTKDGICGTWAKASSSVNHTPGSTNGPSTGSGTLTISGSITRGIIPATTSTVTFDVTSAPSTAFPVELQVYTDVGSVAGELDAQDVYITSVTQTSLADGYSTVTFSPRTANIIINAKTPAGCVGQSKLVTDGSNSTLPVKLVSFNGNMKDGKIALIWKVDMNETAAKFEVERSINGGKFSYAGTVMGTLNTGSAVYTFMDAVSSTERIAYRLKMIDNNLKEEYSKIISFNAGGKTDNFISILQNPVYDKINISFQTIERETVDIRVIDMTGSLKATQRMSVQPGSNVLNMQLPATLATGTYIVSVVHSKGMFNQKLLKK